MKRPKKIKYHEQLFQEDHGQLRWKNIVTTSQNKDVYKRQHTDTEMPNSRVKKLKFALLVQ